MQNQQRQHFSNGQYLSQLLYRGCQIAQYILICVFFFLLTSLSYLYIATLFKLNKGELQTTAWLLIGLWIQFNMIFNYTMCVLVKPGKPTDIQYKDISHIQNKCKSCKTIKVVRSHHCSMCNTCVLQMDHHCPWIGGCVGHHNRAYFLNFITYTLIGLIILRQILSQYMPLQSYHLQVYKQRISDSLIFETYIFITTLIVVLGMFGMFHWYLVLSGKTTLEFCFDDPRYTPSRDWMYNVSIVFGTKNVVVMFMPKFSVLKMKGYQWEKHALKDNTAMIQIQPVNLHDSGVE